MNIIQTAIPDLLIIEPKVFGDSRGFFFESFNSQLFREKTGVQLEFVQDNHSRSTKGVLRGLHYQLPPKAQGKLVRCVKGAVYDVAVDIRRNSPTFGKWVGVELSDDNFRQFWIPPGFAHGFVTLTETADFLYKTTEYYSPVHDRGIAWNDQDIAIQWPDTGLAPQLSAKDQQAPALVQAQVFVD